MFLIDYTSTGYRVFDPKTKKFTNVCNVVINENRQFKDDYPSLTYQNIHTNLFSDFYPSNESCTCPTSPIHNEHSPSTVSNLNNLSTGGGDSSTSVVSSNNSLFPKEEESEQSLIDQQNEHDYSYNDLQLGLNKIPENTIEQMIDYDWDCDTITVNMMNLNYDRIGEYDKSVFTPYYDQKITFQSSTTGPDREKWLQAIQKELDAMTRYDVWELVLKQHDKQAIPMKWVFTIKNNRAYRARLVVIGCRDKKKTEKVETASPTPSSGAIRWLLVLVSKLDWEVHQLDLTNEILNGDTDREKYVAIPPGINVDRRKFMYKLKKALYGLDIAPVCFNNMLDAYLKSIGFERNKREPCIYTKWNNNQSLLTLILIFVDDFLLTGNDSVGIEQTLTKLSDKFEVKNLGFPKTFVGIQIEKKNRALFLQQKSFADSIVQ